MSLDITAIDLFCGAGGSSTGLVSAGVKVKTAVNHWRLAIETHETNHPETDHDCADIRQAHPSLYPKTNIFWSSPECTNHSLAKGKKRKNLNQIDLWGNDGVDPAEERSRATMREVIEFAAYHHHEIVIVENVVDIRYWAHYSDWIREMINLGYDYKELYLNAQFFGVPQSRDRIYIVFWKRGNRAPDLDFRPLAICPKHGQIESRQIWKPDKFWGRYGSRRQYVYRCPVCGVEVTPFYTPAAVAIDWNLPSQRIGDRSKPLRPKTLERILAGLRKFAPDPALLDVAYGSSQVYDTNKPLPSQTTRQTQALLQPFIAQLRNGQDWSSIQAALSTITASGAHHALITPFLTSVNYFDGIVRDVSEPLPTQTTANKLALTIPPFMIILKNSRGRDGEYTLPPRELSDVLTTIVGSASQHALITPFLTQYYSRGENGAGFPISEISDALPTIPTENRHALVSPAEAKTPEKMLPECGFRMLEPHELQRGMSFPDTYVILGTKRDKTRQIGNAVCPYVAQAIAERCVASLA